MYLDYFGLKELPFSIAPDPRYLFMSERHREALAHLLYGVQGQGGFIVLTGEVGTGKTTISRCFLNRIPSNTDVAFIVNPKLSATELLATFCDELHIECEDPGSVKHLNDAINEYLLNAHARQRHTVLMIDEAQNLEPEVLEQLRLLTNLETSEKKLLQIVLLGQPELREILGRKELRQLAQRVTARYHLDALNRVEVGAYVSCRLSVAGRKQRLFSDKAIKALYNFSGGVPRLINLIADRALLGTYASHEDRVAAEHVKRAYYEIQGEQGSAWSKLIYEYGYRIVGVSLAMVLFVGLGVWAKPFLDKMSPIESTQFISNDATRDDSDALDEGFEEPSASSSPEAQAEPSKPVAFQSTPVALLGPVPDDTASVEQEDAPAAETYIEDFADALSSSPDSFVAYVEAPSPDTKLFSSSSNELASVNANSSPPLMPLGQRLRGDKDKLQAYQSVFQAWSLDYTDDQPFRLACEFAQLNGLACLHKQGNWRSLLRIDRPAVLTLFNDQGQKIHLALLKIQGEYAQVAHRGESFTTTLEEIDRVWLGEYSVVWKLPPYKSGVIRPGQQEEGEWLQSGLAKINPQLKDLPLQEQVVEFQRSMGLVPDGIAGSMTLIQMNNLLTTQTPKLLGNS